VSDPTARLDAFTDAAFAFAVTLMVVGGGSATPRFDDLVIVANSVPSFAIGFAIIAMFWLAHVRWRGLRGAGDWRGTVLTLALIFTVLIYVHPLRAMAASFAGYLGGSTNIYGGRIADMFAIYGMGFVAMSLLVTLLFIDAYATLAEDDPRREARGQATIWSILAVTGIAATLMTRVPGVAIWAPFVYATLPVTIGLFVYRYRWTAPPTEQDQ
jgi:uncharacterized membrane protein